MDSFKQALEQGYQFPASYTFKFVVPKDKKEALSAFFPEHLTSWRESRTGKYQSLTCTQTMMSADQIIELYKEIKDNIPELVAL